MLDRRQFLQLATAACAEAAVGAKPALLTTFDYSQVELLDSPLRRQLDSNHAFFLGLSEDRMLKIFRQRSGLPAPGPDMGGWYDDFCPGSHFGQYLSALARFARITNSTETRAKVTRLVRGYAETLDPSGKFFVDHRYPGYTYDKLVLGLLDAHDCAGDPKALSVLAEMTRVALPHMADHAMTSEEMHQRPHKDETYTWDETYTFAENLFLAHERTGDHQYFDLGKRYLLDRGFFDPLAQNQNVLTGLHAYSHVNALSSGIQGYLKLGDVKYLRAVQNATQMILKDQSYATGGWGPNESFVEPGKGELAASLRDTHRHFESGCGSYAHFKLMRYLLAITRDARYADSMERVLYNVALGILPILEDGSTFYYSDYHPGARKSYVRIIPDATYRWDLDDHWPCCSGTFPQLAADYGISTYMQGPDGIYVNLYVPSRLKWNQGAIEQRTGYPTSNEVTLTFTAPRPAEFTVYLRVPAWAGDKAAASVNGRRVRSDLSTGYLPVRREWKAGDRIELELPQAIRYEAVDAQTPNQVALMRGPQVLFALSNNQPKLSRRALTSAKVEKSAGEDWTARWDGGDLRLRPFGGIHEETYQTYLEVTD